VAEVLLLTQDECTLCEHAREIVERLSRELPLTLRTLELSSPEGEALAAEGGILFAPGVFVDGRPFSYGRLSERKLRRALADRGPGTGRDGIT